MATGYAVVLISCNGMTNQTVGKDIFGLRGYTIK